MRRMYATAALWALLLCGCGSGSAALNEPPPFDLPLTQAMLHASATGGQHCDGADYDHGFCQLVTESGSAADFVPDWQPGHGLNGLAYALYRFSVAAEHTQATLTLHWQTAPAYWIGLADASHLRWEWHEQPAGHALALASLAPYRVSGTGILVVIAAVGTTAGTLNAADLETPSGELRKLFFLHHSTGWGIISEGNVRGAMASYNSEHSESFEFWDQGYNGDGVRDQDDNWSETVYNVPGDNTDVEGLHYLWTSTDQEAVDCRNGFLGSYDVIAFKSCFPNATISDDAMLIQYEQWYLDIRDFCDAHPEKLFVLLGFPPLTPLETNAADAARARTFTDWLSSATFTAGHPNVACFNLFDMLAAPDDGGAEANMLRADYRIVGEPNNSHPNAVANAAIGPVFAQFLIDSALAYSPPG